MMTVNTTAQFRKDIKTCAKRGYSLILLKKVVDTLRIPAPLPLRNRNHILSGNWKGHQECHILPDWLLIYRVTGDKLVLVRTGTHTDLLEK